MTKDTFELTVDSTGERYIYQKTDELDNNHGDGTTLAVTHGIMYSLSFTNIVPISLFTRAIFIRKTDRCTYR